MSWCADLPFYRFYVPTGATSARPRADVAEAVTAVHAETTGAPRHHVHCAFLETAPD